MSDEDLFLVKGATFWANHGVYPEENTLGQKFVIDAEVGLDMSKQCLSDCLEDGYSYVSVYNAIKRVVTGEHHKLLQRIAQRIADEIISEYPVNQVRITIKKPAVAIGGIVDYTGVSIVRKPPR